MNGSREFMIGALLSIPSFDLSARVHHRLHSRGFREITDSNSTVMKLLGPEGDRITELANKAGVTKQSMGYLVERLEAASYVERVADPRDGRAVVIRRTKKGWAYNRAAAEEVAKLQEEWTQLLGPAKMKELKSLLAELVAKLGHHYEGSYLEAVTRPPGQRRGSQARS
ncbi:MAG: winged helix-turn-helix transcriptional regulator [Chloroflexi bacterium]|nr:MAG: winged helix-turn-helix transcriptional regulator [Chloroflexota bacterium]